MDSGTFRALAALFAQGALREVPDVGCAGYKRRPAPVLWVVYITTVFHRMMLIETLPRVFTL